MTRWRGHDAQLTELIEAQASGRLHHAWIFAGPRGIGKAGVAHDFAARLLADPATAGTTPDHFAPSESQATRLLDNGAHPDFALLERLEKDNAKGADGKALARNITIDQVRGLSRLLNGTPSISRFRVIVVDAADDLEAGGANALLKSLEEPPSDTIFLLVSHAPGRLLPTIRSRCRMLRFSALQSDDMTMSLAPHFPDRAPAQLEPLVEAGKGSPGRALIAASLDIDGLFKLLDQAAQGSPGADGARAKLVQMLSGIAARPRLEAFVELVPDYLADRAIHANNQSLGAVLAAYDESLRLGDGAITPFQLEPGALVAMLCDTISRAGPRAA